MPPAIPIVAAIAASAVAAEAATAITAFVLCDVTAAGIAGAIGLSAGTIGIIGGGLAGFAVASAIDAVGSRVFAPSAPRATNSSFTAAAQSRAIMIRSSVESHKIIYGQAKVAGPLVYISTTSSGTDNNGAAQSGTNKFIHIVIALAGHQVDSIGDIYFNDTLISLDGNGFVTSPPYTNNGHSHARIFKHLGSPTQVADAHLIAECGLDSNFRLQNIAYIYLRLEFDQDIFASGIPNISAVVNGKQVFDPRNSTTAYSTNAALCTRDYLTNDYGFNCGSGEMNDAYWIAAANSCDESVSLSTGGTQSRYTCNGVLDTANAPLENLNVLVAAMAGAVTYVQGQFRGYAGVYNATVGDIDTTMLAGTVKIHTRPSRQQLFNAVRGTYIDPNKNWQPTDFPPVTNSTYTTNDGGEQIFKDIVFSMTNHPEAAQRIGKVLLEQGRQAIQVELVLNHTAMPYAVWDTVTFTNAALGWDHKVFRIKKFSTAGIGPVVMTLQEESSASYDWNSGEATVIDAAPDTNLPDPFTVQPPGAATVTETLYVTRDGAGVKSKATIAWIASPDVFAAQYQAEHKLSTDSTWTILNRTADTTIDALDVTPGTYDFRVKTINTAGVSSAYTLTPMQQISGLLAPPTEPQNMYFAAIGGLVFLNWDASPDLDVRIGGSYVFRYSPTTSDGWTSSTSIGPAIPGSSTHALLPLKPGIYLGKAVDSSGIESTSAASVVVTQDSINAFSTLATVTEEATFTGTKTNCQVTSSKLTMTSTASIATYLFHAKMDLTTVQNVRLTAHVQAAVYNVNDLIDSRTGLIDSWASIDGGVSADADCVVYVRTTQTDPAGSPTWTAWNRLDSGEFSARGFDFEAILTSYDPAYNINISELSVKAEQVV